jgi:hypothetical protein
VININYIALIEEIDNKVYITLIVNDKDDKQKIIEVRERYSDLVDIVKDMDNALYQ